MRAGRAAASILIIVAASLLAATAALAQCPASVPAQASQSLVPCLCFRHNWWNTDISSAPVDRHRRAHRLHQQRRHAPAASRLRRQGSPGSVTIYGMPYAIVDGSQPKQAVTFDYWDESDGVDYATGQGIPFYPMPAQAITQPHWVEGGAPATWTSGAQATATARSRLHEQISVRALQRLLQPDAGEVVRGLGRVLRHEHEQSPARHVDLRGRRRPRDISRASCATTKHGIPRSPTSVTRFA